MISLPTTVTNLHIGIQMKAIFQPLEVEEVMQATRDQILTLRALLIKWYKSLTIIQVPMYSRHQWQQRIKIL